MKIIFYLPLFYFSASLFGQPQLSSEQWMEDVRFIQSKIHHEYANLFYKTSKVDFDEKIEGLLEAIPNMESHEIIVSIASIIADFKIGHTGISLARSRHGVELKTGFHLLPINFYHFKEGVFVQGISNEHSQAVGARVLRIGSKSIEEALQSIRPVISIENEQFFKAYGLSMLACPEVLHALGVTDRIDLVPILLEKKGKKFLIDFKVKENIHIPDQYGFILDEEGWLDMRTKDKEPLWLKNIKDAYYFEFIKEFKTVYVRQSQIRDDPNIESIAQFYSKVFRFVEENEVDKLVLDLRLNGGGSNNKNLPVVLGMIKSKLNREGRLFVIIGRNTFSAAQNLVNNLETYTGSIFVGEATSQNVNSFGDTRTEILPNSGIGVRLSFLWHQDKHPLDKRIWTVPDLPVEMSSNDFINNYDPVLDAVLNFESSPMADLITIKTLFKNLEFEKAKENVKRLRAQLRHDEMNIQSKLNSMGYELMNDDLLKSAEGAFLLNTELYPESANTWDSLAECYLNIKDIAKAIETYQKVIKMDPNGRAGDRAREMLIQIQQHSR